MGKLIYSAIASLDGYVEDQDGGFAWSAPDEEVLAFVNELERPLGTYLYGRRMYETMAAWETIDTGSGLSTAELDFTALWRAADKIVYSRTLQSPTTTRTRIEREFDPATVRQFKESSVTDISVGGAELAGVAIAAGLVDEIHLLLCPVLVGGGKPALPSDVRVNLTLVGSRQFAGGVVHLHYRVAAAR